ncbi:MAG: hypothetical protein WCR66_13770, partial [Bacteroidota bacterium]
MKTKITKTKKQSGIMMQWLLSALLVVTLSASHVYGQTSIYTYSTTAGNSLMTMNSPTNIVTSGTDDAASVLTNIGFTFNFAGTDYTQFWAGPNGIMGFGAPTNAYLNNIGNASPTIMPWWDDLYTATNGYVEYQLFGTAPNRILVVEWAVDNCCSAVPFDKNFQVWLTETSNQIQIVYGTGAAGNSSSIGIANSASDFISVNSATNAAGATAINSNSTWPAVGTAYVFDWSTPIPCVFTLPEDFSGGVVPPGCWAIDQPTLMTWQSFSAFGVGTGSMEFDFYDAVAGTNLNFTSPTFTPTVSGTQLSFDEAYAGYDDGAGGVYNDQLIIQTSTDGGVTYTPLITYDGDATGSLNTGGMIAGMYYPPASSEWQTKSIMLPIGTNRVWFQGASQFGNELYLDNVNIVVLSD